MNIPDLVSAAIELVTEFGSSGTYTTYTKGGYDVQTSKNTLTASPQTVKMVLLDLTLKSNGLSQYPGTTIIAGDKEAYILPPANPITISPGSDKVTYGGVVYTVVTFKEINPTGIAPIVFMVYLRR